MSEIQKRKILVIDNDRDVCNLISVALGAKGIEVIIVSDHEKAIEKAKEIEPDLIFISLFLSGSNGLKVSSSIYSIESLRAVPIFLLISEEFDSRSAGFFGIVDVIVKPLNTDKLVSKTLKILSESTLSPKRDEISHVSSIISKEELGTLEEGLRTLLSEKKPGDSEGKEAESIRAKSESMDTSEETIISQKEDYENKESDKGWKEGDHEFFSKQKKNLIKKLSPIYVVLVILAGLGIVAFFFTDTGQEFLSTFLKSTSEKKELVQNETITETISIDDRKTKKIVPFTIIDDSKKVITPEANTDNKDAVPKKPLSSQKPGALEKTIYSVQAGAFLNEENAVSIADKFKQKGYDTFIRKALRTNKKTIHKVLIGKFSNKNKALEQSKIIRQKEGINSFVYHY